MNAPMPAIINPHYPNSQLMKLEEARKILWLRTKPRPLGELYDEGYLDQSRLEWAATHAYNPRLKQAAQVLLAQSEQYVTWSKPDRRPEGLPTLLPGAPLDIGITLEQARATPWPLPPFKGQPMGQLVETKKLSLKELGYAAENAWQERVRRAASALMLVRLNQTVKEPAPSAGFIKVVSYGRSFSERKQLQIVLIQGIIIGIVFGLVIAFCIWGFIHQASTKPTMTLSGAIRSPVGIIALAIFTGILGVYFLGLYLIDRLIIKRLDKQIDSYRVGEEGEEKVVEVILQSLDGNWSLFRNISLPGRNKADLDAVLVGPSGVWALEIKNFSGEYRNIGEQWEYRAGNRWRSHKKSPSWQAQNNAVRLGNFLKADGIQQWVDAAVIWANQESPLSMENPTVAVWPLEHLPDELGNVWQDEKVLAETRAQIEEKLTKLCQR
jgi:hypothetical protein